MAVEATNTVKGLIHFSYLVTGPSCLASPSNPILRVLIVDPVPQSVWKSESRTYYVPSFQSTDVIKTAILVP